MVSQRGPFRLLERYVEGCALDLTDSWGNDYLCLWSLRTIIVGMLALRQHLFELLYEELNVLGSRASSVLDSLVVEIFGSIRVVFVSSDFSAVIARSRCLSCISLLEGNTIIILCMSHLLLFDQISADMSLFREPASILDRQKESS
ncbi:hypothetical protein Tco_1217105 [Tanacetum coccineum]